MIHIKRVSPIKDKLKLLLTSELKNIILVQLLISKKLTMMTILTFIKMPCISVKNSVKVKIILDIVGKRLKTRMLISIKI